MIVKRETLEEKKHYDCEEHKGVSSPTRVPAAHNLWPWASADTTLNVFSHWKIQCKNNTFQVTFFLSFFFFRDRVFFSF